MTAHHVPKGVSLDTLKEIIAGWDAVGAAAEPRYTSAVEDATGITDTVGRQTRFLEELGVLEAVESGQKHRLTGRGQAFAGALAVDDDERAGERARGLLTGWPATDEVRGVLRGNPTDEETLVPLVADLTEQDLDVSRVRSGITTLLELYEWAGVLDRDEEGRYRIPEERRLREVETRVEAAAETAERAEERVEAVVEEAGATAGVEEPAAAITEPDAPGSEAATDDGARNLQSDGGAGVAGDDGIEVADDEAVTVEIEAGPGITISVAGEEDTANRTAEEATEKVAKANGSAEGATEEVAEADESPETAETGESPKPAEDPDTGEGVAESVEMSDVEALLTEVGGAVEEARAAAAEAREAAREVREGPGTASDDGASATAGVAADASDPPEHALSLDIDVDGDPSDLEGVVRALRRGLVQSGAGEMVWPAGEE